MSEAHRCTFIVTAFCLLFGKAVSQCDGFKEILVPRHAEQFFNSPNYPGNYSSKTYCRWKMNVPSMSRVLFRSYNFNLQSSEQCEADYVEIIVKKKNRIKGMSLGKWCGNMYFCHRTMLYNKEIDIVFRTDEHITNTGFVIGYQLSGENEWILCGSEAPIASVEDQIFRTTSDNSTHVLPTTVSGPAPLYCGGNLTSSRGFSYIESPGYPNPAPLNIDCHWYIRAKDPRFRVKVIFLDSQINSGSTCDVAYISISDPMKEIVRWCGNARPSTGAYWLIHVRFRNFSPEISSMSRFRLAFVTVGSDNYYIQSSCAVKNYIATENQSHILEQAYPSPHRIRNRSPLQIPSTVLHTSKKPSQEPNENQTTHPVSTVTTNLTQEVLSVGKFEPFLLTSSVPPTQPIRKSHSWSNSFVECLQECGWISRCRWKVAAEKNDLVINLHIQQVKQQSLYDCSEMYALVYDGIDETFPVTGIWHWYKDLDVQSSGKYVFIAFHTVNPLSPSKVCQFQVLFKSGKNEKTDHVEGRGSSTAGIVGGCLLVTILICITIIITKCRPKNFRRPVSSPQRLNVHHNPTPNTNVFFMAPVYFSANRGDEGTVTCPLLEGHFPAPPPYSELKPCTGQMRNLPPYSATDAPGQTHQSEQPHEASSSSQTMAPARPLAGNGFSDLVTVHSVAPLGPPPSYSGAESVVSGRPPPSYCSEPPSYPASEWEEMETTAPTRRVLLARLL